jgi:rhodanese-related sulfurtransferase
MAGILAAAVVLGLIYNHASPLGIESSTSDESTKTSSGWGSVVPLPFSPANPTHAVRTGYVNQTVAMNLERATPLTPPPSPQAAPTPSAIPTPNAPDSNPAPMQFVELKWPEVKALLVEKKIVLIDARLKANFDIAHIPGAISLPATSGAPELQEFATKYPKDTRFVTYCGSSSCHMSRALAESLVKICGYTNVSEMPGGFAEYQIAEAANKSTQ